MLTKLFDLYFILIITDLITGIIASGFEGRIKSATMRRGLWTTVGECVALVFTITVCNIMPELNNVAEFIICSMLFKEGISICENLGRAGIWLPPWLKKALEIFSEDFSKNPPNIQNKNKK